MNKYFLLMTLLLCGAANLFAGETFLLKSASQKYNVKITFAKCAEDMCQGAATVYLLRKNQTQAFQTIKMPEMYLELDRDKKPTGEMIELTGENNSGAIFDDFNFDGTEDLALRNGSNGVYGSPSYDVFLFSKATGKFAKNTALTKLASDYNGLFDVDKKQKTIETINKSGCCWYQMTRYRVVNNRPVKIYVQTEDMGNDKSTTEILVNGKWKKTIKTTGAKDNDKEQ